jgi:hypothetical protein
MWAGTPTVRGARSACEEIAYAPMYDEATELRVGLMQLGRLGAAACSFRNPRRANRICTGATSARRDRRTARKPTPSSTTC